MLVVTALTVSSFLVSAGCVSYMRNLNPWAPRDAQKTKPPAESQSSSAEEKALKRPKIPDIPQPASNEPEGSRTSVKVSPERSKSDSGMEEKKKGKDKAPITASADNKQDATAPPNDSKGHSSAEKKEKDESSGASTEPEEKLDKKDAFKKHDHVGYVELVKKKAQELIAKQSDCTFARLCRHSVTDEWTLQVYVREPKSFSFVLYSWDEIDEKWQKSYTSEKRPSAQWDHHLRFTSASKECTDLKGKAR
jgi:hypothetical protein